MLTRLVITAILTALSVLPTHAGYPVTVKDSRGKEFTFTRQPARIVSLAPSNTEILFALGLESRVVGVTRYCDYPYAAAKKPVVGDRTISTDRVISLKPDLVLAHGTLNDEAIRTLEKHNIRVFAIDPKTIGAVVGDIRLIGRIMNREKQAAQVAGRISSAKAQILAKVSRLSTKPRVLIVVQADPLWTAGPGTFVAEMVSIAGGVNVARDSKPGFRDFSSEIAVMRDPEVIIGTTVGDKKILTKGIWAQTSAARSGRVYEVDPDLLFRPGPRLADGMLMIARILHPNEFRK